MAELKVNLEYIDSFYIYRLKLFKVLNLKQNSSRHHDSCCTESLGENENDALNTCIKDPPN